LEQFLKNFLFAKLDGSFATHAQPTNQKIPQEIFQGIDFFISGGEEMALSILEETKLHLPQTTN